MHRQEGFIHVYLYIICTIFVVVVVAYHIGKKIPNGEIEITDRIADRYEEAGIEKPARQPSDRQYDSYEIRDIEPKNTEPVRTTPIPVQSQTPPQSQQLPTQLGPSTPNDLGLSSKTFTSKINNRISFDYPVDATVTERNVAAGSAVTAIVFTIKNADNRIISMTYDKVTSGCFDPIRAFAVDPATVIDYRIIGESQSMSVEGKYEAQRTDEEIGSYTFAGSNPNRPFIYTSNVCVRTAVPTRIRLSSTQFKAGEQAVLVGLYDLILSRITL
jgi:hypothetical protein